MVLQHELLLALAGHAGGEIFVDRDGTFRLAPDLPLLDPAERQLVESLAPLGRLYRDVARFVERQLSCALGGGEGGLYVRAMCRGIDAELDAYRHALVLLEQRAKSAPAAAPPPPPPAVGETEPDEGRARTGLSIVRMQHELAEYREVLPELHRLVETVEDEGLRGARLLEHVHACAGARAVSPAASSLRRVLRHCNAALVHQMRGWMIHGVRLDPHAEFFVQPAAAIAAAVSRASAAAAAADEQPRTPRTPLDDDEGGVVGGGWATPGGAHDHLFDALDELDTPGGAGAHGGGGDGGGGGAGGGGGGGGGGFHAAAAELGARSAAVAREWASAGVSLVDKPAYVPLRLAERVLFVGKAARVLEHRTYAELTRAADAPADAGAAEAAAAASASVRALDARLGALQWAPAGFDALALGAVVDDLRAHVAARLHSYVVQDSALAASLEALRGLALLGRGDLWHAVVQAGSGVLGAPREPSADALSALLHAAVHAAAAQLPPAAEAPAARAADGAHAPPGSAAREHAILRLMSARFALRLEPAARPAGRGGHAAHAGLALERWRRVRLAWRAQWPAVLVLPDSALQRYNQVFSFLLTVRVTQMRLQGAWLSPQTYSRASRAHVHAAVAERALRPLRALRAQMAFLVENLQFYLHADVLEAQWRALQERMEASSDFEQVARAHDAYLSALSLQTFRHVPAVCDALDEILDACDALCALAEGALDRVAAAAVRARVAPAASASAASAPPPARPYDPAELSALSSHFAERAAFLLGFLRSVSSASPGAAPHLAQLLLRVDFNGFFSAASAAAAAGAGA